jgi:hypothetical protein
MADGANPTMPGIHNHFRRPVRAHDPANPRKLVDRVFGDEAPIIEGLAIEVGHGALSPARQLAEHVVRIFRTEGREAARIIIGKLFKAPIDQTELRAALEARGLIYPIPAAARRGFDELKPNGAPN